MRDRNKFIRSNTEISLIVSCFTCGRPPRSVESFGFTFKRYKSKCIHLSSIQPDVLVKCKVPVRNVKRRNIHITKLLSALFFPFFSLQS
jgi:hypothetical protein